MAVKNLTLTSDPTGIEMRVDHNGLSEWIVTPKAYVWEENTPYAVFAPRNIGESQTTPEKGLVFRHWQDDSTENFREGVLVGDTDLVATYEVTPYYPVRRPDRRHAKFEAKTDEEVSAIRTTALKPMMVEQYNAVAALQDGFERKVGKYLMDQGLYGIEIHHYRNFSQELWGLTRMFSSATLDKEASLKAQKWADRELDPTHLTAIAKMFGITVTIT